MMENVKFDNNQLTFSGNLVFASVPELLKQCQLWLQQHPKLVINFEQVGGSDSSGVALLLAILRYAKKNNKTVQFHNIPQQLSALAEIAGVNQFIQQT